jgi:hypothetical protein
MSESEVYSLFLNSASSGNPYMSIVTASLVQRQYSINWDSFFNGANLRYKKCKLRYDFFSDPATGTTQMDPGLYNSLLVLSGLNANSGTKYPGLVAGLLSLETVTTTGLGQNTWTCLKGSTIDSVGQNIIVPTGLMDLTIGLYQNVSNPLTLVSTSLIQNWGIILSFELYDPVEVIM